MLTDDEGLICKQGYRVNIYGKPQNLRGKFQNIVLTTKKLVTLPNVLNDS